MMPVLVDLDHFRAGVIGDAAAPYVMQCNGQIKIAGIVVLVLDIEDERLLAGTPEAGSPWRLR